MQANLHRNAQMGTGGVDPCSTNFTYANARSVPGCDTKQLMPLTRFAPGNQAASCDELVQCYQTCDMCKLHPHNEQRLFGPICGHTDDQESRLLRQSMAFRRFGRTL
jgi:hypothetical protein